MTAHTHTHKKTRMKKINKKKTHADQLDAIENRFVTPNESSMRRKSTVAERISQNPQKKIQ